MASIVTPRREARLYNVSPGCTEYRIQPAGAPQGTAVGVAKKEGGR
jgi:hypothetical protein